jgi:hypothetical protein
MTTEVLVRLVADLEARSGTACGRCCLPHRSGAPDEAKTCSCCPACAESLFAELAENLGREFPDVVPSGRGVVTEEALEVCISRMEVELASLSGESAPERP